MATPVPARVPQVSAAELSAHLSNLGKNATAQKSSRFEALVTLCEILADVTTVVCASLFAYWIYHWMGIGQHVNYSLRRVAGVSFFFALAIVLLLDRTGAYEAGNSLLRVRETEGILKASVQSCLFAFAVSYFSKYMFSRGMLGIDFLAIPAFLVIQKQFVYWIVRELHSRGYGVRKVIIYGAGMTGRRLFSAVARSPKLGLDPVLFVDDDPTVQSNIVFESSYRKRRSAQVVQGPLSSDLIRSHAASMVIIGIPSASREKFLEIANVANAAGATVSFVPYHLDSSMFLVEYADIDGLLLASFRPTARQGHHELIKRAFDFGASLLLLVLAAPVLLCITAIIRISSPGSAIFVQRRIGLRGKIFNLYKFRTMCTDAPQYDYSPTSTADPRITRIGRFLRRTSLDELPQIMNVLKGEMSLVGPRPEMPFIVEGYNALHRLRLMVKPGITGLWQLSADRASPIHENIEYDLYYIRNRCFFMDLAILLHTVIFAAKGI